MVLVQPEWRQRSLKALSEQMLEVAWFIKSTVSREDAEALAGPGYRSLPCGGCGRQSCAHCDRDPTPAVPRAGHAKRQHPEPRFVAEVIGRVGAFSQHVFLGVPRELAGLPPLERLSLLLVCGAGFEVADVARQLKCSGRMVQRARDKGLATIAHKLWDEAGRAVYQ